MGDVDGENGQPGDPSQMQGIPQDMSHGMNADLGPSGDELGPPDHAKYGAAAEYGSQSADGQQEQTEQEGRLLVWSFSWFELYHDSNYFHLGPLI